jgi:uncharacterized protein (TIGR03083 family)
MGMDVTDMNDSQQTEIREMAALLALDAIDEAERSAFEDDVDPVQLNSLRHVASALADITATLPPADLRERVLAVARTRRTPGFPLADPAPANPVDAFVRTVEELHDLLVDLRDDEWTTPNLAIYGQTRDLIAHLVGVEENLLGLLGEGVAPDPDISRDHVMATSAVVLALRGTPTSVLVDRWIHAARRLAALASSSPPDTPVAVNDIPTTVRGMLVLRTFEVWTHHEDVCRATGRPRPLLDGSRLRLMSSDLMDVLPAALTVTGVAQPGRTVRIVLTGLGGGTFVRPMTMDGAVGTPDVVITSDVVDFCRLAAQRIAPDDLDATIEGDAMLAQFVLQAAGAFARD